MELVVIVGAPVVVAWLISRLASRRWSRRVLFIGALGLYFLVINRPGSMVVRGEILSYPAEPWMTVAGYALLGIAGLFLLLRWLLVSSRRQLKLAYCRGLGDGAQLELRRQLRWR